MNSNSFDNCWVSHVKLKKKNQNQIPIGWYNHSYNCLQSITWVAKLAPDEKPPTEISLGSTEVKEGKESWGDGGDGGIGTHPWTEEMPRKMIMK